MANSYFKNDREQSDFFIALVVIGFFIWLFGFSGLLGGKVIEDEIITETPKTEIAFPLEKEAPKVIKKERKVIVERIVEEVEPIKTVTPIRSPRPKKIIKVHPPKPVVKKSPVAPVFIDSDNDGVEDALDKCPQKAGKKENDGCPEIKKEVIETINLAGKNIQFESASARLKRSSYRSLNAIIDVLRHHPKVIANIKGHTDKTGIAAKNLKLSQARANTVKKYFTEKGVRNIMIAKGYGDTQPIATNRTKKGRFLNRRVEVELSY